MGDVLGGDDESARLTALRNALTSGGYVVAIDDPDDSFYADESRVRLVRLFAESGSRAASPHARHRG